MTRIDRPAKTQAPPGAVEIDGGADGPAGPTRLETLGVPLAMFLLALMMYIVVPLMLDHKSSPAHHFVDMASAFSHGELAYGAPDLNPHELIPSERPGLFYFPYPPLPGLLLLPLVVIFGGNFPFEHACAFVGAVNVLLFDLCLIRLPGLIRLPAMPLRARLAFDLLFAFGTVTWHNAYMGGDWHLAHAVALAAMLLALREAAGSNRPIVVGLFIALVVGSRPTAALGCLFFFLLPPGRPKVSPRIHRFAMALGPAAAILALAWYNHARFGDPLDFGYTRMMLSGAGRELMERYGQFDPRFIATNFFWFFLAPFWPSNRGGFPYLGYDPRGLSLFLASPAMIFAVIAAARAIRGGPLRRMNPLLADPDFERRRVLRAATIGIACSLVPLLMHFNTGYWQFGHRFSLDYLPMLMVLTLAGMGTRPRTTGYALISLSVMVNAIGVLLDPVATIES